MVLSLITPIFVLGNTPEAAATTTLVPTTSFEIDGSVQSQGQGDWGGSSDIAGPTDGSDLYGPGVTPIDGYATTGIYYYNRNADPCGAPDDDIGVGGTKVEDGPLWPLDIGSVTAKDDLQAISLAAEKVTVPGAGGGQINDILYASFERCGGSGGSMSTLIFIDTGDGLFPSEGFDGDYLFRFDFDPSDGTTEITMFLRTLGAWVSQPIPAFAAEGSVETTEDNFGEVALNLTTLGVLPSDTCRNISVTGAVATVAGNSLNSQPKDLVQVTPLSISNCGALQITKTTNVPGTTETFVYAASQFDGEVSHGTDLDATGVGSTSEPDVDLTEVDAVIAADSVDTWENLVSEPDYQIIETLTGAQIAAGWSIEQITCSFVDVFDSDGDLDNTEVIDVVLHDGTGYTGNGFLVAPATVGTNPIDSTTCEIRNSVTGVVVTKAGTGDTDQPFDISVNGTAIAPALTIDDSSTLVPFGDNDAVTVTEVLPATTPGWTTTSIECSHAAPNPLDPPIVVASVTNGATVNFNAVGGQVIECVVTNDQQSQIIVEKLTDPADATDTFDFTISGLPTIVGLGNGASANTGNITPGTYTITELMPVVNPPWALAGVVCGGVSQTITDDAVSVTVAAGQVLTCTFSNAAQATLIVDKVVTDAVSDATFAFTGALTGSITTDGGATTSGEELSLVVLPGNHLVTETVTPGYTLDAVACNDADSAQNGNGAAFIASAGETVTCTFTNSRNSATFTIDKSWGPLATPGESVDLAATVTGLAPLSAPIATTATAPAGAVAVNTVNVYSGQTVDFTETFSANSGQYTTTLECTRDSDNTPVLFTAAGDNRSGSWAAGDNPVDVTCRFVNTVIRPSLTLIKEVINNSGGTSDPVDWTLTAADFDANDALPGTYAMSETGPTGYTQTSLTCDNIAGQVTEVTLVLGETVTCTFINNDDAPSLTLIKTVINDNGGTAAADDWTLAAGTFDPNDPQVGTYTLSETGPTGYTQTSLTCDNVVCV